MQLRYTHNISSSLVSKAKAKKGTKLKVKKTLY